MKLTRESKDTSAPQCELSLFDYQQGTEQSTKTKLEKSGALHAQSAATDDCSFPYLIFRLLTVLTTAQTELAAVRLTDATSRYGKLGGTGAALAG